jgi:hypothetical protein
VFTVAAFLPFLPLIEDAMIRQLGDDDFSKRETATRFLERMLRDTDGLRNYDVLLAVKKSDELQRFRDRLASKAAIRTEQREISP